MRNKLRANFEPFETISFTFGAIVGCQTVSSLFVFVIA